MSKIEEIIFCYYPLQFVDLTLGLAFKNIAKQHNIPYTELHYLARQRSFIRLPESNKRAAVFYFYDPERSLEHIKELKIRLPNCVSIQLGGDFHYTKFNHELFNDIDIHIDTIKHVGSNFKNLKTKYHHYYWSISEDFIKIIEAHEPKTLEKNNDIICLCTATTRERQNLFRDIKQHYGLLSNLKEFDINKIITYYKQSKITLGTSTSCMLTTTERSMKGFRDWIAPFCDSILIYDDIDEMKSLSDVVPIYTYNNIQSLFSLLHEFKNNKTERECYIARQKQWAIENTIDKQLIKILETHNLL